MCVHPTQGTRSISASALNEGLRQRHVENCLSVRVQYTRGNIAVHCYELTIAGVARNVSPHSRRIERMRNERKQNKGVGCSRGKTDFSTAACLKSPRKIISGSPPTTKQTLVCPSHKVDKHALCRRRQQRTLTAQVHEETPTGMMSHTHEAKSATNIICH